MVTTEKQPHQNAWSLFEPCAEASVEGVKRFVVEEKFRVGEIDGVKIDSIGPSFKDRYYGKI